MGLLKRIGMKRDLGRYGYPGEHVELWVGFNFAALQEYWGLKGDTEVMDFIAKVGVYVGSSFTNQTGASYSFQDLPWDVQLAAARELNQCIVERHSAVFQTDSKNGAGGAEAPAAAVPAAETEKG